MFHNLHRGLAMLLTTVAPVAIHGQIYKLHQADVGVSATGEFTRTLTSNSTNQQYTTDALGFLFSLKEHPVSWAGVELNYGYNKYAQQYAAATATAYAKSYNHEFTGAYLFHPHIAHLQPFVAVGGGAIDFQPEQNSGPNQWRGAGLLEAGLDVPTGNPHLGFRFQGRTLIYRAPNFYASAISTQEWVVTIEPAGGVYIRF